MVRFVTPSAHRLQAWCSGIVNAVTRSASQAAVCRHQIELREWVLCIASRRVPAGSSNTRVEMLPKSRHATIAGTIMPRWRPHVKCFGQEICAGSIRLQFRIRLCVRFDNRENVGRQRRVSPLHGILCALRKSYTASAFVSIIELLREVR